MQVLLYGVQQEVAPYDKGNRRYLPKILLNIRRPCLMTPIFLKIRHIILVGNHLKRALPAECFTDPLIFITPDRPSRLIAAPSFRANIRFSCGLLNRQAKFLPPAPDRLCKLFASCNGLLSHSFLLSNFIRHVTILSYCHIGRDMSSTFPTFFSKNGQISPLSQRQSSSSGAVSPLKTILQRETVTGFLFPSFLL